MYPADIVAPMAQELVQLGVTELKTPEEVTNAIEQSEGTTLVVVNSVCGCAAANARPGVGIALGHSKKPDHLYTVFAGVDKDATSKAREYFLPYPPSSPSMALFKDGQLVHFIERLKIEGHTADQVAGNLISAFEQHV